MPFQSEVPEGFDAPWQAEAYGVSQALIEAGHIDAEQWATTLSATLSRKLHDEGLPDNVETYSTAVIEALGELTSASGVVTTEELEQRSEAWRSAYLRTPHGKPVKLK